MAKITEVRLTLAALIYGIEIDLKSIIKKHITPFHENIAFIQNIEAEKSVKDRFEKENPGVDLSKNIDLAIEFLDFQEIIVVLNKNAEFLPATINEYLKSKYNQIVDITPIRNRVMHTRPLLGGDFATVFEFISNIKHADPINWSVTLETKHLIEKDPNYVLTLTIPTLVPDETKVIHNLPVPDFDETGFIGRKKDVDDIKN